MNEEQTKPKSTDDKMTTNANTSDTTYTYESMVENHIPNLLNDQSSPVNFVPLSTFPGHSIFSNFYCGQFYIESNNGNANDDDDDDDDGDDDDNNNNNNQEGTKIMICAQGSKNNNKGTCPSCKKLFKDCTTKYPYEIFKRIYPGLILLCQKQNDDENCVNEYIQLLLRKHNGNIKRCINDIEFYYDYESSDCDDSSESPPPIILRRGNNHENSLDDDDNNSSQSSSDNHSDNEDEDEDEDGSGTIESFERRTRQKGKQHQDHIMINKQKMKKTKIKPIQSEVALSSRQPTLLSSSSVSLSSKLPEYNEIITTISVAMNVQPILAEFALEFSNYDPNQATEYLLQQEVNDSITAMSYVGSNDDKHDDHYKITMEMDDKTKKMVKKIQNLLHTWNCKKKESNEKDIELNDKRKTDVVDSIHSANEYLRKKKRGSIVDDCEEIMLKTLLDDSIELFTPLYKPIENCTEDGKNAQPPPMISERGHRMVLATVINHDESQKSIDGANQQPQSLPFYCKLCTSKVPSSIGGMYYCELCHMCEGCIQQKLHKLLPNDTSGSHKSKKKKKKNNNGETREVDSNRPFTIYTCPAVSNGGHLHHHPLKLANNKRTHCVCDVCDLFDKNEESDEDSENSGSRHRDIGWFCEECDFDICFDCARQPPPLNYDRIENSIEEKKVFHNDDEALINGFRNLFDDGCEIYEDEENVETDNTGSDDTCKQKEDVESEFAHSNFRLKKKWEGGGLFSKVILGGGILRDSSVYSQIADRSRTYRSVPISKGHDDNLPDTAINALYVLGTGNFSAADMTLAEDILRCIDHSSVRLNTSDSVYQYVLKCISAGKIGLAGSLLLSNCYGHQTLTMISNVENSNDENDATITDDDNKTRICWCGDVINEDTAPDGVVGCLGGHAMHPSCACDLLLGGGKCPTCRQTLFFSQVAPSEIKAASNFVNKEIQRVRFEEEEKVRKEIENLTKDGLHIPFNVGDIVIVPADKMYCKKQQCEEPRGGYWHDDMASACGLEGIVTAVKMCDGKPTSIRVISHGFHRFKTIRRVDDFECQDCLQTNIHERRCVYCNWCETCCRRSSFIRQCKRQTYEWNWNPSLIKLLRRFEGAPPLALTENSETWKAEKHILCLRGELVSIKAAREAVQEETKKISNLETLKMSGGGFGRQLSASSGKSVFAMAKSGVSQADWQRAEHLLMLAKQWGQSDGAKSKRTELYQAVKDGDLDSVARIVRRFNAERTVEESQWRFVSDETSDYVVDSSAVVDLRAIPSTTSPRTGFVLNPRAMFSSELELLDRDGNLWVKVKLAELRGNYHTKETELPLPPPQGWIQVRPGGDGSAPIVRRLRTCLRCFSCGHNLLPAVPIQQKYEVVPHDEIKVGDTLLLAVTLEKVQVKCLRDKHVGCIFLMENQTEMSDNIHLQTEIMYRPCDLLKPKLETKAKDGIDETALVNGRLRSRRELVLSFDGDVERAKKAWNESTKDEQTIQYASCARGHLLHARCLQQAMITGSRCPAPGCMEQLYFPRVTKEKNGNDDTCCSGGDGGNTDEEALLRAESDFTSHSARVERRTDDGSETRTAFRDDALKMCPMCCSGPLYNKECSDMSTHHGQCSVQALGGNGLDEACTPEGDFRVTASEIAAKVAQVSATKTVLELLPRCEKHNAPVMFNGCMTCGYLFTDITWYDMPVWDPKGREYLELDKKRRNAAQLLTEQIRSEAAKLQFERDAFCEAGGKIFWETVGEGDEKKFAGWMGGMDSVIVPPPTSFSTLPINDNENRDNDSNSESSDEESHDESDEESLDGDY